MWPVLVQWGGLTVGSYAALLSLGLAAATMIVAIEARRRRIPSDVWLDTVLAAITIGVVTARLGYVLINWVYFKDHLRESLAIWEGGLSWHAGLLGGAVGAWLIAHRSADHRPIELLDLLASAAPLGLVFGWLGCYLSAAAYGQELFPRQPFFFLAIDAPDLYGAINPRWPSQLLGAAWSAVVFAVMWLTRRRAWPAGLRWGLFLAAYSVGAWLIGFTRGDDIPHLAGWRLDQVFDMLVVFFGLLQLGRAAGSKRHDRSAT